MVRHAEARARVPCHRERIDTRVYWHDSARCRAPGRQDSSFAACQPRTQRTHVQYHNVLMQCAGEQCTSAIVFLLLTRIHAVQRSYPCMPPPSAMRASAPGPVPYGPSGGPSGGCTRNCCSEGLLLLLLLYCCPGPLALVPLLLSLVAAAAGGEARLCVATEKELCLGPAAPLSVRSCGCMLPQATSPLFSCHADSTMTSCDKAGCALWRGDNG